MCLRLTNRACCLQATAFHFRSCTPPALSRFDMDQCGCNTEPTRTRFVALAVCTSTFNARLLLDSILVRLGTLQEGQMALRWCSAQTVETAKQLRPVNGYLHPLPFRRRWRPSRLDHHRVAQGSRGGGSGLVITSLIRRQGPAPHQDQPCNCSKYAPRARHPWRHTQGAVYQRQWQVSSRDRISASDSATWKLLAQVRPLT